MQQLDGVDPEAALGTIRELTDSVRIGRFAGKRR